MATAALARTSEEALVAVGRTDDIVGYMLWVCSEKCVRKVCLAWLGLLVQVLLDVDEEKEKKKKGDADLFIFFLGSHKHFCSFSLLSSQYAAHECKLECGRERHSC